MHRNAPLTPEGRLRLCERIESGWSVAAAADRWGSPVRPHTSGGVATGPRALPGLSIDQAGPGRAHTRYRRGSNDGSWRCASPADSARLVSPVSSVSRRRRCTGCWSATGSID